MNLAKTSTQVVQIKKVILCSILLVVIEAISKRWVMMHTSKLPSSNTTYLTILVYIMQTVCVIV